MTGVFILIVFAIAGAGIDFGRAQLVQMKEQQASDIATLAAANVLDKDTVNPNESSIRESAAKRYYSLNFPMKYLGVIRQDPAYSFDKAKGTIVVSNSQNVKTNYINTIGRDSLDVASRTAAQIPDKNMPDFDVVMVIDESGSTKQAVVRGGPGPSRISLERDAISTMVDNLFPDNQPQNLNLRFGLVGHSGPIDHAFGLSSDKDQVKGYVKAISNFGETYTHWGLEAGLNMITGVWNGFVPPRICYIDSLHVDPTYCLPERNTGVPGAATLRDDGQKLSKVKYMVLLTDGEIMYQPLPCPGGWDHKRKYPSDYVDDVPLPGDSCKNYRALYEQCDKVKAAGVTLYTINFAEQTADDITAMTKCATSPDKYFFAPDGNTLKGILSGIAKKASKVRITE